MSKSIAVSSCAFIQTDDIDSERLGDDGARAARPGESGDRRQQMKKQDDQIAHGTIMPPREIQEMLRIWQFAMHRLSKRKD